MFKSIAKEVFIMILLAVAILAILGVLFYDYIPASKTLPTMEAYKTPENVIKEIENDVLNESTVVQTYTMDDAEINISKKQGDYKAGRQDPFAEYSSTETTGTSSGTTGTSSSTSSGSSQSDKKTGIDEPSNNDGSYLPNRGTK